MSLADSLRIRLPLIWLETDEFHVANSEVIALTQPRSLFRFSADTFQIYDRGAHTWKLSSGVVGYDDTGKPVMGEVTLENLFGCLAREQDAVFLHFFGEELFGQGGYFTHGLFSFLDAWDHDDMDKTVCTLVLVGPPVVTEKIPPSFRTYLVRETLELPTQEELATLIQPITTRTQQDSELGTLSRSLKGLGFFDAQRIATAEFANHGQLDQGRLTSAKIARIKDASTLEIRAPRITMDEIGGLDNAKELIASLQWCYEHPADAARFGVTPVRRILLVGVPGTGKSAVCEAAAGMMGLELAKGGVSAAMDKYLGESEKNVRNMFKAVNAMAPVVFWIDELGRDLSGSGSSNFTDGGTTNRAHGEFLGGLQDLNPEVYLFCAANRIDDMPPEMLRADRFDKFLFVGLPSPSERAEIFRIHLGAEAAAEMELDSLAAITPTYTGAEIKALVRETRFWVATKRGRAIRQNDLHRMIKEHPLKGRVWDTHRPDIIASYKRAVQEWDWASSEQEDHAHHIIDSTENVQAALGV